MNVQRFPLATVVARRNAVSAVQAAPVDAVCEIRPATRSLEQNARLWAALADISRQVPWPVNGSAQTLSAEEWKDVFTASLREENRIAQGLRGGFVMLGASTRRMSVGEMGELIELIQAFGAERGVRWSGPVEVPGWYQENFKTNKEWAV